MVSSSSVAKDEVERFSAQAQEWWNPQGALSELHRLAPLRLAYVCDQILSHKIRAKGDDKGLLSGLRVLDMGCGGGLMAEALAGQGAVVTGIDASAKVIAVAKEHAQQSGLAIDYREGTAEALAKTDVQFDVVIALEIVEHVANLKSFIDALAGVLAPGGIVIIATINKTKRSYLLGVLMAEYVLGWVRPGTHDWDKFVPPSQLVALLRGAGLQTSDLTGLVYRPLSGDFALAKGKTSVNYFMTAQASKKSVC